MGFVIKHWSSYTFDVAADRDQEFENTTPSDTIIIKKLPEAEFLSRDRQILGGVLPLWFSFNSSAGFLDRTEPEYETPRFVGRLDVYPEVTTAFHFAGFSLTATGAIRETEYGDSIVNGVISDQGMLRNARELDVQLIPPAFERIFQSPKWLGGDKVKHVIEPRIDYKLVGGIDNFNNIIRFDENDIMSDTDQVTFSLTNRLFVKDNNGNVNEVCQLGSGSEPLLRSLLRRSRDSPASETSWNPPKIWTGSIFLDGPRNYSPIVSIIRFQHVVGVRMADGL